MKEDNSKNETYGLDTLNYGEAHPASCLALEYIRSVPPVKMGLIRETLASCSVEDNRMAVICSGTLRRLDAGLPVSDRYVMGLAWAVKELAESSAIPERGSWAGGTSRKGKMPRRPFWRWICALLVRAPVMLILMAVAAAGAKAEQAYDWADASIPGLKRK